MSAEQDLVPVHFQSPSFTERDFGPFRLTLAAFGATSRIAPHFHDRPNLGIMIRGSFDLRFGSRSFDCPAGSLFIEPAGDRHCNCIGCRGAVVLAIQPDAGDPAIAPALGRAFDAPAQRLHPGAASLGRRLAGELRRPDEFSPLIVHGIAFELLGAAGRSRARGETPPWLERIESLLREGGPPWARLTDLAREAGVHPGHLAREFRRRYGRSIGGYLVERRLEWARSVLRESDRPLSAIAMAAGFADQSHFTRRFRALTGQTPARYRRQAGPRQPVSES